MSDNYVRCVRFKATSGEFNLFKREFLEDKKIESRRKDGSYLVALKEDSPFHVIKFRMGKGELGRTAVSNYGVTVMSRDTNEGNGIVREIMGKVSSGRVYRLQSMWMPEDMPEPEHALSDLEVVV